MTNVELHGLSERFSQIDGKKVVLRPFSVSDVTGEYVGWLNDPDVVKYSNQRFVTHSKSTCAQYVAGFEGSNNLFVKIERKVDQRFIGTMTVYVSVPHGTADVGIMVGCRTVWGQGIGSDAWSTMLAWLLETVGVRKVTAGTMRCNLAMVRLMEGSGMVLEAVRPMQELLDGIPQDIVLYGKFRDTL